MTPSAGLNEDCDDQQGNKEGRVLVTNGAGRICNRNLLELESYSQSGH